MAATTIIAGLGAASAPASASIQSSVSRTVLGTAYHHDGTKPIGALGFGTGIIGLGLGGSDGVGPMSSGGGPVQLNPSVYVVYWGWHGSDPSGEAPYLQSFLSGIGGSPWANINVQYTDGSGAHAGNPPSQFKGSWFDDTTTPTNPISDAQIAGEALVAEAHFGYSADANYFVATPHGISTSGFAGNGGSYCAYHGSTPDGSGRPVAFTNMPYMTDAGTSCGQNYVNPAPAGNLDGVSIVGGHEWSETITDPQPSSGWTDVVGDEIGDKCAWISTGTGPSQDITIRTGTFAVQSLWSNAAGVGGLGDCAISYP